MDSCLDHPDLSLHTPADADRRVWHFNVAFIGSCQAGKTKLLQRFVDSQFSDIYSQTVETSFVSKSVSIDQHHVVFRCWDTPGSARSAGCLDPRLTQLHAIFVVFDASRDAIADLEHWHHLAMTSAAADSSAKPLLVMVANKTDLGCHEGTMTRARDLCQARGVGIVFALSVLSDEENLEVNNMMLEVGKALTERHAAPAAESGTPQTEGECAESPSSSSSTPELLASAQLDPQHGAVGGNAVGDTLEEAMARAGVGKTEDGGEGGGGGASDGAGVSEAGKSWWARALCCCSCW